MPLERPRLAVVGPGRFFRKLEPFLRGEFELLKPLDHGDELAKTVVDCAADAVALFTPNGVHAQQVSELAPLRLPTLVEKPLATTSDGLALVRKSLDTNPRLYASDFYPDVRAAPLLDWFGRSMAAVVREAVAIEGDVTLWMEGPGAIGRLQSVRAVLLEGEGDSRTFEGRPWLWDKTHGGVLWDLAYHYLTLWHILTGDVLELRSRSLDRVAEAPLGGAETHAVLDLRSSGGVSVTIEVGKYMPQINERWMRLDGSDGYAIMTFSDPNALQIWAQGLSCRAVLTGSYYRHTARAFRSFVDDASPIPHGLDAAISAIGVLLPIKEAAKGHE